MFDYGKLTGRPYSEGRQDCYQLARDYYQKAWSIRLPNYARPTRFWEDPHLDLYQRYQQHGFKPVFDNQFEIGDAVLMPIGTAMNSHVGIIVDDNVMLHHFVGELSTTVAFRPKWERRVTVHLRHPQVSELKEAQPVETVQLHEVLDAPILRNPNFKKVLAEQLERQGRAMRDRDAQS